MDIYPFNSIGLINSIVNEEKEYKVSGEIFENWIKSDIHGEIIPLFPVLSDECFTNSKELMNIMLEKTVASYDDSISFKMDELGMKADEIDLLLKNCFEFFQFIRDHLGNDLNTYQHSLRQKIISKVSLSGILWALDNSAKLGIKLPLSSKVLSEALDRTMKYKVSSVTMGCNTKKLHTVKLEPVSMDIAV